MSSPSSGSAQDEDRTINRRRSLLVLGSAITVPLVARDGHASPVTSGVGPGLGMDRAGIDRVVEADAFGAVLDGHTSDTGAIRRALNHVAASASAGGVVRVDRGQVLVDESVDLVDSTDLVFGRAPVSLRPSSGYALGIGWKFDSAMIGRAGISGRSLTLFGRGQTAIAIRNGSGAQITATDIDLRDADQTGIRIAANDKPLGPYYGLVNNIRVNGNGSPGQCGIVLEPKPVHGSICVNRWIFSDLRHIASVDIGIDVQGADGVIFNNVNFESCSSRAVRFGFGSRTIHGTVTGGARAAGGFVAAALAGMALDPTGAIKVLSGANAGESMPVITIDTHGTVIFPADFPGNFAIGDRFVFTESKCRSVAITNATNEGGSGEDEVGFEFLAGAQDCRVSLVMTTMIGGHYFVREIEDPSNTIARRIETISYNATLDPVEGVAWLPVDGTVATRGGTLTRESCWVDAIYVTAEDDSGGTIAFEVFANGIDQGLAARLTSASPFAGRRIRTRLAVNAMVGPARHIKVRATRHGMRRAARIRVDVVLGFL